MKYYLTLIISLLLLTGCRDYKAEEFKAIEDITNEYLYRKHLPEILNPYHSPDEPEPQKPNIDSLDLKVYISDALMPINQVKEDDNWLFTDTLKLKTNDSIFHALENSGNFKNLNYREIDKRAIKLKKPYRQIYNPDSVADENDSYLRFHFSRICFDENYKYGILYLEYLYGYQNGYGTGQVTVLLIMKQNGNWTIIEKE
jgi:hypothetical protein